MFFTVLAGVAGYHLGRDRGRFDHRCPSVPEPEPPRPSMEACLEQLRLDRDKLESVADKINQLAKSLQNATLQKTRESCQKPSRAQPVAAFPSYPAMNVGSGVFIRIAGVSGAAAVALGAYGAHHFAAQAAPEYKKIYDTANFYHFMHSVALLGVPLTPRPLLTGALMVSGMTVFCGTTYYHALTQKKDLRKFTPYGGILLILAWLSMLA